MTARPATLEDLEVVTSWITSSHDCELWAGWRVRFPIDRHALPDAIQFHDAVAVSVVNDGQLAAFGQLIVKPSRRGHLARLIVSPALRGRGLGEALVHALLERARAEGCRPISLNVNRSNSAAVRLYSKLGFRDAARPADEADSPGSRYMERRSEADL